VGCEKEVPRLFYVSHEDVKASAIIYDSVEVCGCCSISLSGRMPGIVGQDYTGQIDPENFDPVKEKKIALKYMEQVPKGHRDHATDAELKRWNNKFVVGEQRRQASMKKVPKGVRESYKEQMVEVERNSRQRHDDRIGVARDRVIQAHRIESVTG
jgi:hypothetical protein